MRILSRPAPSIDTILAQLDPTLVEECTRAFLASLDEPARRQLAVVLAENLDDDERGWFADMGGDVERFLIQHRRGIQALPPDAARAILVPAIATAGSAELAMRLRAALPKPARREPVIPPRFVPPLIIAATSVVAGGAMALIAITFRPAPVAPSSQPPPIAHRMATTPARHHAIGRIAFVRPPQHIRREAPRRVVSVSPSKATPARAPHRAAASPHRKRKRILPPRIRVAAARPPTAPVAATDSALLSRARLIVMSYLDSLMRGDASAALADLGLSASAGTANLREAPVLAGASEFRIVRAIERTANTALVLVEIDGPQGRFAGQYVVSANGGAAWIVEHDLTAAGDAVAKVKQL